MIGAAQGDGPAAARRFPGKFDVLPGVLAVADKALVLYGGAQRAFGPRDEVLAALQKANQNNNTVARVT